MQLVTHIFNVQKIISQYKLKHQTSNRISFDLEENWHSEESHAK